MNLSNKIVLAHKGYFNTESKREYRENSKEVCQISSTKDYISIIELDLRKSGDGILYCYHGNFFEYYISLKFPKNFSVIKDKYRANTLAEILDVINEDKIIFLDIKDRNITREDIQRAFAKKRFTEVILAHRSVSYLECFNEMPREFVKFLNLNIFSVFYDLEKLKKHGFKYIEVVFPFQVNKKLLEKVHKNNLELRVMASFFLNKKSYWKKINKYNLKHISSDFI